jgi:hypothetical protein
VENDDSVSKRVEGLISAVKASIKPGLDETLQTEYAAIVGLLPDVEELGDFILIATLEVAVAALAQEKPNLKLASDLRVAIEDRVKRTNTIFGRIFFRGVPSTRVIIGLGLQLFIVIPIEILVGWLLSDQMVLFGIDSSMLAAVVVMGALGSIVSIMVRIQEFAELRSIAPSVLVFTGLFKPMVGMSFALFVFGVLKSGLFTINIPGDQLLYFYAAVSFVAGFSERFARDIVSRTEQTVSGTKYKKP